MRKLLLVGIMILCVGFVYAQDDYEVKETVIKDKEATYDNIDYLEKNFGHVQPGEIIYIKPDDSPPKVEEEQPEEVVSPTPPTPESENVDRSSSSRNVTSSGSTRSSSARKSTSRKRSKRKKIGLKRKRSKIKRKPKLGNRAACPRF